MSFDIRLFSDTEAGGGFLYREGDSSSLFTASSIEDIVTSGVEIIAGKVLKFLLTSKGSDPFDKEYGAYLTSFTQISESYVPRMALEVRSDIKRCQDYITREEASLPDTQEKLSHITLLKIDYNPKLIRDRVDIHIEIKTNKNNTAALRIKV